MFSASLIAIQPFFLATGTLICSTASGLRPGDQLCLVWAPHGQYSSTSPSCSWGWSQDPFWAVGCEEEAAVGRSGIFLFWLIKEESCRRRKSLSLISLPSYSGYSHVMTWNLEQWQPMCHREGLCFGPKPLHIGWLSRRVERITTWTLGPLNSEFLAIKRILNFRPI